jgi:hypothetical protein
MDKLTESIAEFITNLLLGLFGISGGTRGYRL